MLSKDIGRTYNMLSGNKIKRIIGCFRAPGVHAVITLRFGQWLLAQNILLKVLLTPLYLYMYRQDRLWGIEIPRNTSIGEGFYIGHYGGITISHKAKIGVNCTISQLVTIGVSGAGDKRGAPIIGDNVYIAPGAKLFGKITIGNNVKIGANAVIHKDIPDNAIVVLNPGYSIIS
ncbi:MAG: serine acetyltransferase [Sulfuricurvum sp.]|uniref:serine O-acetyltransferase n=1 Tax=Sulfuricurvum sp. TaxID=2025608 RepID=UPI0026221E01|nr:serine acetyltransferase [Sulfuricurvum sp.]MDD2367668.1 serine acetyltransferase [Sulfuricurvum sp.]MDD2951459.1 serine acetyltransferase [Sulfuricurvum sp.]MDD5118593.1 serine acetyltransferase [Sulfuricurvum sp.]